MLDLPLKMASLEIQDGKAKAPGEPEGSKDHSANIVLPYKLRKKFRQVEPPAQIKKRRCHMKPTKRKATQEMENLIRSYYMPHNQVVCPRQQTLQTIYEEPICKNGHLVHIGAYKLRQINFNGSATKEKLRKRKAKLKKIKKINKKRLSMDAFLARLSGLMSTTVNGAAN